MNMSLEGTPLCSPYHVPLLPYFLAGLSSQLPNYSHSSPLFSATCQRSRTSTQACMCPQGKTLEATAHRVLFHSSTELSQLPSPAPLPGTLGRQFEYPGVSWHLFWIDIFLAHGGFWHLSVPSSPSLQWPTAPSPCGQ